MQQTATINITTNKVGELESKLLAQKNINFSKLIISGPLNDEDVVSLGKYVQRNNKSEGNDIVYIQQIDLSSTQSLTSIDHNAFEECIMITDILLPNGITRIGDHAFHNCYELKSIHLPDGIEIIGDGSFRGCKKMTSINIPSSVTYIGVGSLNKCRSLSYIDVDSNNKRYTGDHILFDTVDKTLIKYLPKSEFEENFPTPQGVLHIGNYAFDGCKGLKTVTVSEGCTDLGECTFIGCNDLTSIKLPSTLNHITFDAFDICNKLEEFIVADNNEVYCSKDGVLYSKDMKKLILCPNAKKDPFFIPASVDEICEGAFSGCKNLKVVDFPTSLQKIDNYAFKGCSSLRKITFPKSLIEIGNSAFSGCSTLNDIQVCAEHAPNCGVSAFADIDMNSCQLEVPIDCEMNYRGKYGWDSFTKVTESFILTLFSNFPGLRRGFIGYKQLIKDINKPSVNESK